MSTVLAARTVVAADVELRDFWDFAETARLLHYDFVWQALIALALLGALSGVLAPLIVSRQMSFAVHGASELSVTGAAAALLAGVSINLGGVIGAVLAAAVFGFMGNRARERDSVIGVVMAFGLGLGVLFLALYGRIGAGFALLTGQVVSVGVHGMTAIAITTAVVLVVLAVIYRPLLFASLDPRVAQARGVPMRVLSVVFAILVGLAAAQGVQIIGALLVMSLMITPGAAAARLSANPTVVLVLSVLFAEIAAVGGLLLSLAPQLPVSVFVTTISFVIYLVCRAIGSRRTHATRT
ncbi:MAG TPA: metal ABC transporter permease [Gordonia polyisoprenivorans]|uniref:Metal ABC transporter permease n=1 Tax=Gordonia polyisoprenivorans TaxID=84595 RepID=A0A846WIP9_9ACTN|nr:metal ABC transporter permease [Gordonia polyisoprenivorans]MBE7192235.1 metal ABC transporter permease [Gordonia polyisoprenivorans]NKY00261.1 metal ABC transporter permease [Gordonia polyisoprenivorans]GAB25884.1 putative ABC transporter permease protein [Gordonia polyisoprenivorans NBRC 16320 = JCM 10675]HCS57133.1 metal ABC transporter permease [Gordonia polyisoprenivorans]